MGIPLVMLVLNVFLVAEIVVRLVESRNPWKYIVCLVAQGLSVAVDMYWLLLWLLRPTPPPRTEETIALAIVAGLLLVTWVVAGMPGTRSTTD